MAGKKTAKKASGGSTAKAAAADKRVYFSQADFPQTTLQQAQKFAAALVDNFAGKDRSPPDVALAIASARQAVDGARSQQAPLPMALPTVASVRTRLS